MVQVAGPAYKVLDRNHHPSAADMLGTFWTKIDRSQFPFLFRTSEISHSRTKKRRAWNVGRQFCHHAMDAQLQYLVNWTYSLPQPPKFPVHYCLTKWVQWSLSSKHFPSDKEPEVVITISFFSPGIFQSLNAHCSGAGKFPIDTDSYAGPERIQNNKHPYIQGVIFYCMKFKLK